MLLGFWEQDFHSTQGNRDSHSERIPLRWEISYPDNFEGGACPRYSSEVLEKDTFDATVSHSIGRRDLHESVENIGALDLMIPGNTHWLG